MTDQNNDKSQADDQKQEQAANGQTPINSLPPDIQKYIEDLRTEAAAHRKAQKAAEAASKAAEDKRLAEQQEWKMLADKRAEELAKLQPIAEQHETITAAFNASLDNRLKQIPDDVRKRTVDPIRAALSPVDFSNWLDANLDILRARPAPNLDGGAGGNGTNRSPAVNLTQHDLEMAHAARMTPEQWAKRKAEAKADRARPFEE